MSKIYKSILKLFMLIAILLAPFAEAATATKSLSRATMSCSPSTFNEGQNSTCTVQAIYSNNTTKDVTSSAKQWRDNSNYTSVSGGRVYAPSVPSNQTVSVQADYQESGKTVTASSTVTVKDINAFTSYRISCPSTVNENSSGQCKAYATIGGSEKDVTASSRWTENTNSTTISSSGVLVASSVTANTGAVVTASYTSDGVSKQAQQSTTIKDVPPPKTLSQVLITCPTSLIEGTAGTCTASAVYSDGAKETVSLKNWKIDKNGSVSTAGKVTASQVTGDQTATVKGDYTYGGKTVTGSSSVIIKDNSGLTQLRTSCPTVINENSNVQCQAYATINNVEKVVPASTWAENTAFTTINSFGVLVTSEVTADSPATVKSSYTYGGVTKTAEQTVTVKNVVPTLSRLDVSCPASINESSTANCTATAILSNGTKAVITNSAKWSSNSVYASIDTSGKITTPAITADQNVTFTASYTYNGVTKTAGIGSIVKNNTDTTGLNNLIACAGLCDIGGLSGATTGGTDEAPIINPAIGDLYGATCYEYNCNGLYPESTQCKSNAILLNYQFVGKTAVELWASKNCGTKWITTFSLDGSLQKYTALLKAKAPDGMYYKTGVAEYGGTPVYSSDKVGYYDSPMLYSPESCSIKGYGANTKNNNSEAAVLYDINYCNQCLGKECNTKKFTKVTNELVPIAKYMADEINKNLKSKAVSAMKSSTKCENKPAPEKLLCIAAITASEMFSISTFTYYVRQGGEWDHKKYIGSRFMTSRGGKDYKCQNPASGEATYQSMHAKDNVLYNYDIWSNIHYGYIGRAAGFSKETLNKGADIAQIYTNAKNIFNEVNLPITSVFNKDDPKDKIAVEIGYELFDENPNSVYLDGMLKKIYDKVDSLNVKKDSPYLYSKCQ